MPVVLAANSYGKSSIRLTKVRRLPDSHELTEWTVDVQFTGDFAEAYTAGDNRFVVATDTMKNRVYVLAQDAHFESPEEFAIRYGGDMLKDYPQVESASVRIAETAWQRIHANGEGHQHAFRGGPAGQRTCTVKQTRTACEVTGGIKDVPILKTADSAFRDFHRDEYRTLPDTDDRILATLLNAEWLYAPGLHDWNLNQSRIRAMLFECFAGHHSFGVQQTLYAMGEAVLKHSPQLLQIDLTMPNRHRIPFNMLPFQRENANEVFITTDEPFGLISATLKHQ